MTLVPRRRDTLLDYFTRPAEDLFDELDKLLGFSSFELPKVSWSVPMVNTRSVEGGQEVEVAAPGLEKGDFKVSIESGRLCISVSKEETLEEGEEGEKYKRREFNYSSFTRYVPLDRSVNREAITARYENGLLIVFVPFEEKPDRIEVEVA